MTQTRTARFFTDVEQSKLLLVEGNDDARVLMALLSHLHISNIQVATVGGKDNFRRVLVDLLPKCDNFHRLLSLGIVRDADQDATASFQSIRDALQSAQLPTPARPWEPAQIGQLAVAVSILPDGTSNGELEDLCLRSIEGHPGLRCVDEYLVCVEGSGPAHPERSKAMVHAYLAAGADPGLRIGEAADAGVWDWSSPAFRQVEDFLRAL